MDDSSASPLVNLVVRNVYTPAESLALSIDPQTLVGELKRRLSVEFPSSPSVSSQKLIFGGKICRDDESLEQILSIHRKDDDSSEEAVVLHLLVSSSGVKKSVELPQTQPKPVEAQDSPRPNATEAPSFIQPTETPTPQPQSMLMQQQAMVLQQIQYLQCLLMQQRQTPDTPNAFGAQFPAYGNFYGMMQPQMFHAQATPNVATHAAQTPATPAAAQAEAPVEPRERPMIVNMAREVFPLLDLRMALKMAFMLFIIGQDTPLDRILMLGLLSFISYLHITGIFAKIYEVYNRHRSANGDTEPNAQADPNAPGAAAAAGAAIANRYGMLTRVLRISADRGFVQDVKYFVVGLLLSLVPAWHPQPIQGAVPMPENAMPDDVPLQGI
ncbi:putative membrane protein [Phytophthora megakarya]|uniref:Putative membrane protein n=1 Tax=Phytophthora megakarya TaxID=4795 RepID=A0A225VQT1_9STRA|nr:putative membrane protein [Phytophthora megakarya]